MAEKIIIKGRKIVGGYAEGEALVSKWPVMGLTNFCPQLGIITERDHPLRGVPLKGKVFRVPNATRVLRLDQHWKDKSLRHKSHSHGVLQRERINSMWSINPQ